MTTSKNKKTELPKKNRKTYQLPKYVQRPQEANAALIYPMAQLLRAAAATGVTTWAASKVNPETTKSIVDKAASYVQTAPVAIYNTYRTLTKPTGQGRVNNTAVQSGQTVVNDATAVQRPTIAYTRPHSTAIKMSDIGVILNRDKKVNTDTKPVGSEQTSTATTSTAPVQPEQNPEDEKQEEGTQQGEQNTEQTSNQKPELPKKKGFKEGWNQSVNTIKTGANKTANFIGKAAPYVLGTAGLTTVGYGTVKGIDWLTRDKFDEQLDSLDRQGEIIDKQGQIIDKQQAVQDKRNKVNQKLQNLKNRKTKTQKQEDTKLEETSIWNKNWN